MGELRVTAIGVDELRTLFSGNPAIEDHLRAVAAQAFPAPAPVAPGRLLGKVGPVLRIQPDAPVVRPDVPTGADLHDLTRGRFIKADRLTAAWALVRLWLDACGWPTFVLGIDEPAMNELDFELATGGVPTRYALRRLLNDKLALPLRNAPGQVTGYVGFDQGLAMREAWQAAVPTLSPHNATTAHRLVSWLGNLEGWADFARRNGHPLPDLVASFTTT